MHLINMKKLGLIVFGMFVISMSLGLVSAGPADDLIKGIQEAGKTVFELVRPVLESVIGETAKGETFLAKLLFLVIIFAVVWMAISKIDFFKENDWVLWIVSIAISVLAIRWFGSTEFVMAAILPYSVLGIAISAGLPFVLAFLIIENILKSTMRKFAWIFFAVIFVGLWFSRYDELGNFGYIYLVTAGLSIVMMIMDGTIQKWRGKMSIDRAHAPMIKKEIDKINKERKELTEKYSDDSGGATYESRYSAKKGLTAWKYDMEILDKKVLHLRSRL